MSDTTQTKGGAGSARIAVQKFGTFLSGMIMPNIPALIAWGLVTAFFIPVQYMKPAKDRAERPCLFRVIDRWFLFKDMAESDEHTFKNSDQVKPFQEIHFPAVNGFQSVC